MSNQENNINVLNDSINESTNDFHPIKESKASYKRMTDKMMIDSEYEADIIGAEFGGAFLMLIGIGLVKFIINRIKNIIK